MKRVLGLVLALVSIGFVVSAEAKAAEVSHLSNGATASAPQWQHDRYGRRNDGRYERRRSRTITRSRVVRYGRRLYRETYAIRYLPNGRTNTWLISRQRIG